MSLTPMQGLNGKARIQEAIRWNVEYRQCAERQRALVDAVNEVNKVNED